MVRTVEVDNLVTLGALVGTYVDVDEGVSGGVEASGEEGSGSEVG